MDPIFVTVAQEDIDNAVPDNCFKCAVSLALIREIPGATQVDTQLESASWVIDGTAYFADLPEEVTEFIDRFDEGQEVSPIEFMIIPEDRGEA